MNETSCTYRCGACGQRFKVSVSQDGARKTYSCPKRWASDKRTVVPAFQYGSRGSPMAPEFAKFGLG